MRWRTRRKLIYTTLALLPLFVIAAVIYTATFFPEPTCSDGVQNQNEAGVDCGGECERVCQAQTPSAEVVWDRAFRVSDDIYNVAAYIQNPNTDLVARDVPYTFRIYDQDNILITERRGEITLLPQPNTVAFAGGVKTNGRQPGRVVFEFTQPPFWQQTELQGTEFSTTNRRLQLADTPRLSVEVTNENTRRFENIFLTALVFDQSGEAVHASRTLIDSLDVQETAPATFTWRQPFSNAADAYQTEIVPTLYEPAE